jgi:hypothetical protein
MMTTTQFREFIENGPYVWPGGYPLYFVTSDGAALSFEAAEQNTGDIEHSIREMVYDGWKVVAAEINWEDPELYCDHTGKRIESAYAED